MANNGNNGGAGHNNGNVVVAPAAIIRERYQHPALVAIINEAQGIKFRGKCAPAPSPSLSLSPEDSSRGTYTRRRPNRREATVVRRALS